MARPKKRGLAYFPLDTDFMSDRKIQRLLLKHGCEGITTYLAVLCETYRTYGYYLPMHGECCFDIGFTLRLDEKHIRDILDYCVDIHLFDRMMLEEKNILTSPGIQERWQEICKRNKEEMDKSYRLERVKTDISAAEIPVYVTETLLSVTKTPTKGKGKGKINKTNTINKTDYEKNRECNEDDATRQIKLQWMANLATTGSSDA